MQLWYISVVALCLLGIACVIGLFSYSFRDNVAQTVGMSLLGLWAWSEFKRIAFYSHYASGFDVMMHVGLLLYAGGVAYKVYKYRDENCQLPRNLL